MDDNKLRELFPGETERRPPLAGGESELEWALGRRMQECVETGTFPLEVQFALDYFVDGERLRCRTRVLPSDPPTSPPPVLVIDAVYKYRFEQFRQAVIDRLGRDVRQHRAPIACLVSLARIDADCFCELGGEYFAGRLESPENEPPHEPLPLFVLFVHDVDPEMLSGLVARTQAISPPAASRLRMLLLNAIDDPSCADELGLLAAQSLRDHLDQG